MRKPVIELHLGKVIIFDPYEKPIINGGLLIENSKIKVIGKKEDFGDIKTNGIQVIDHKDSLICPGFINLHTHLLYSNTKKINGSDGLFPWLDMLFENTCHMTEKELMQSVQTGINESLASGTTFLVENTPSNISIEELSKSPLKSLVGLEVFGSDEEKADEIFQDAEKKLVARSSQLAAPNIEFTFSPHAPYDVSRNLWKKLIKWSEENKKPLLTHLEESPQEKLWWQKKSGPAISFWKKIGKLEPKIKYWKKYNSGIDFLYKNKVLSDTLIATHATQATKKELEIIKKIKLIHCPRSNHYLNNGTANLRLWDELGILWGIGTDSLASNDNLSMLSELKFCLEIQERVHNYKIPPKQGFLAITLNAAKTVSKEYEIGSLKKGFLADFLVFNIKTEDKYIYNDPCYSLIWYYNTKKDLKEVWINGKNAYTVKELLHKI